MKLSARNVFLFAALALLLLVAVRRGPDLLRRLRREGRAVAGDLAGVTDEATGGGGPTDPLDDVDDAGTGAPDVDPGTGGEAPAYAPITDQRADELAADLWDVIDGWSDSWDAKEAAIEALRPLDNNDLRRVARRYRDLSGGNGLAGDLRWEAFDRAGLGAILQRIQDLRL